MPTDAHIKEPLVLYDVDTNTQRENDEMVT